MIYSRNLILEAFSFKENEEIFEKYLELWELEKCLVYKSVPYSPLQIHLWPDTFTFLEIIIVNLNCCSSFSLSSSFSFLLSSFLLLKIEDTAVDIRNYNSAGGHACLKSIQRAPQQ